MNEPEGTSNGKRRSRYEQLYETVRQELEVQIAHFNWIESKAGRHAVLLGLVVGGFAVSLPATIEVARELTSWLKRSLLVAYGLLLASTFRALYCLLRAHDFVDWRSFPMGKKIWNHFREYEYVDVLESLAWGGIQWHEKNRVVLREKVSWARSGQFWTWVTIVLAALVLILYAYAVFSAPESALAPAGRHHV